MDGDGIGKTTLDNLRLNADSRSCDAHAGTGRSVRYLHRSLHLSGNCRCVSPAPPILGERLSCVRTKRGAPCLRLSSPFSFYRRSLSTRSWAALILAVGYGTCWLLVLAPNGIVRP